MGDHFLRAAFCGGLLVTSALAANAETVFTDGTFNLSNYSESTEYQTGGTTTVTQCGTCGNPGSALQITTTQTDPATTSYSQAFVNNTFSYNPSTMGAISTIGASIDKNVTYNFDPNGFGNSFHPVIEQNGNFYVATVAGAALTATSAGSTGFINFSTTGLTADDFTLYDFSTNSYGVGNPDFDEALAFGLAQITTVNGSPGSLDQPTYDNLEIDVTTTPLPSTWAMMVAGIAGLGFMAGRSHKRSTAARSPANI